MNPIDAIAKLFGADVSRHGELVWAIEESAHAGYLARSRSEVNRVDASYVRNANQGGLVADGRVAIIPIHGVMVQEPRWDDETSTVAIARMIHDAAGDDKVSAIVLSMDTPGGSVAGLKRLGDAVDFAMAAKSVVSQVGTMCCSAGYEIACHTGRIYAERDSLVGSIGTKLHVFDWSAFCQNLGIKSVPINTGEFKSTAAFGTELTDNQRAYLQEIVDDFQSHFATTVQHGRGMTDQELAAVATGRVWTGERAVALKLIDGVQGMGDTLAPLTPSPTPKTGSKAMSEPANDREPQEPKAVTTAELKKTFPNSTAEWREEQTEAGATMAEAAVAYAQFQEQQAEEARKERDEAKAEAEKAAKAAPQQTTTRRGNAPSGTADTDEEANKADYRQMAIDYQEKHNCRWSEACLEIKRRHPEAAGFFGLPPAK